MLSEKDARQLCQQVLGLCGDDPAQVLLVAEEGALTRFANNHIHQNVAERDLYLVVQIYRGLRAGMATTNRTDDAGLEAVVELARASAEASPENPDQPGPTEPVSIQPAPSFDEYTAGYPPEQRARQVGAVCRLANERGLTAAGAFSTGQKSVTVANSLGLFAYRLTTLADFQTVVMGPESSGRAQASAWQERAIPVEQLGRQAIETAARGQNPRAIEPGEYPVVFEPYVTQDLLSMLDRHGMDGKSVHEGRSWMNGRMGKQAMSPLVSIWDDGLDPQGMPQPFDYEGVPKRRVSIVEQGVVGAPVYDRLSARKAGARSSGHALPPGLRRFSPLATNLFMAPGESSLEDLIQNTPRGLYVNRFWYTRLAHPRDCVVTGMTRDGVFMIEAGELAYPVKNLRFTQSYVEALNQVEAVSREQRLLYEDRMELATRVPALKIAAFNFTGSTV